MTEKRVGRPPIGDRAMTDAERQRRYRSTRSAQKRKARRLAFEPTDEVKELRKANDRLTRERDDLLQANGEITEALQAENDRLREEMKTWKDRALSGKLAG